MCIGLFTIKAILAASILAAPPAGLDSAVHESLHSDGAKRFMPGVWINWQEREVEVEARVVLREGMLELFACSPLTREHESILRVDALPSHVYQALGLIGLEAGSPPAWDDAAQRSVAASGSRLAIRVRYAKDRRIFTERIQHWLWDARQDQPAPPTRWVFSGSVRGQQGRLAADAEGTVICVVDFGSALISLPRSYSADNENLWLEPAASRIPPLGSACLLLIRGLSDSLREIRLGRFGRIWYEGTLLGRARLAQRLDEDFAAEPELSVEVQADGRTLESDIEAVVRLAQDTGVPANRVSVARSRETAVEGADLVALITLLSRRIDVSDEVPHNIWPDLRAAERQLVTVFEAVGRGLEPLVHLLWPANGADSDPGQ